MKKFIVALDGLNLSNSSIQTAIRLSKFHNAHLVGVFLDDFTRNSFSIYEVLESGQDFEKTVRLLAGKDARIRDQAVIQFEEACQEARVNYSVHRDKGFSLPDLLRESIYADLLILDANETFARHQEIPPTRFVKDLLAEVQCPVFLVPKHYMPVEKVVMLYDGAPTAVFAIKMFSHILPCTLPAEVVTVKGEEDDLHLPENKLMKEFMKRRCPQATYTVLKGEPETEVLRHLQTAQENTLIVLGAYQRSAVSRWFKNSMADVLLRTLKCPLFIAHNK
ncbi:universal stress protein [Chitinophaga niabensis]|uniref:Universal stress protein family protein n=1 Tax=Chitinophaga niabensis TaxID=536979 RepID=A0A1N6D527_9BACT|nr:universal stress protein [Chitinophaga niabensis]SIN65806.1 Universal stress protein family protein [Chitinophaga niabensis]